MSSPIGKLLVREGLLRPAEHLTAVEQAEDEGQLLITALVSLGYVSEDRLVELFHRLLLVPIATPEMLRTSSPSALQAVRPEMAKQFLLIPFGEDHDENLLVAMADASDGHAVDEVIYHSGRRVVRYAATLGSIRWAIGAHYGLDLGQSAPLREGVPSDEIVLLTKVKIPGTRLAQTSPVSSAVSKTISGYPPGAPTPPPDRLPPGDPKHPPVTAPSSRGPNEATASSQGKGVLGAQGEEEEDAQVDASGLRRRRETLLGLPARRPPGQKEDLSEPYCQALAALKRAQGRDDVGRTLLSYFEAFFLNVLFLVVRRERLVGWRGGGTRISPDRAQSIDVPLGEESSLRDSLQGRLVFTGSLGNAPGDLVFVSHLGYRPEEICLAPVQVQGKVLGLVYGDSPHSRIPAGELDTLLGDVERTYQSLIFSGRR